MSLQWTYRDGRLVNLPVSLLVEGDIISLRPGSEAPTELRGIQEEEHVVLSRSDVFSHLSSPPSPLDHGRSRPHRLLQPQLFRVTRTPAVEVVQRCLELSQHRPVSVLDNERFTVQTLLERGPAPLALVVLLVLNTLRYVLGAPGVGPWHVTLLQLPVNGILPLLPLTFPLLWLLVGIYGEVRVLLQMDPQPTALWEVWKLTCGKFFSVLFGRSSVLCHTASLLHNLGSVTVLCCVDKQGILSWPSPNPEKILFFSKTPSSERVKQKEKGREKTKDESFKPRPYCSLEMLSLSLDRAHFDDTRVQFDDMQWERHAPSLRPLGLAIQLLLGDAAMATRVLRLSDHLTHAALLRTRPPCQPVRPPWGLCQLPQILGFSPLAREPFQQRMSVAAYTLPTIPCSGESGVIAPPPVSMRRLPFSHLIALLVHHAHTGDYQLFSYGSADAVLSTCSEFWNGEDLQTLTDSDRKKVVDFYQRSCMAGQCVAVSFKPLLQPHDLEIDGMCVELPASLSNEDAGDYQLFSYGSADAVLSTCSEFWNGEDLQTLTDSDRKKVVDFYQRSCMAGQCVVVSFKPLLQPHDLEIDGMCVELPASLSNEDAEDVFLSPLKQQIFLGLVSSQYQVRPDMVRLISGLDSACIRFVYFSNEEEVRSKVFAEKMGLETGWNCHISLQSECFPLDPENIHITEREEQDVFLSPLKQQIFLGLVSSQYQVRPDMVRLISGLDSACIRFVYFSNEEEVRSKVFAEKMGLETGWNCHISLHVSLLGKPSDSSIMKVPTGKNLRFLPKKTLRFFVLCFSVKFGLTVCVYLTCFGLLLHAFCLEINHEDEKLCHPTALLMNSTVWSPDWFGKHSDGLSLGQKVVSSLVLLYAMCTSVSHVHRSAPLWKQNPLSNISWCAVVCTLPILSVSIATGSSLLWHDPTPHHTFYLSDVPLVTWLLGILWLLPLIFINEGIKLHEIRMRVRYQKRQKLQFDTKLGMNSPF
ncbi:hypothetical protein PDJAM_G00156500 [Pangasius djambal]|uniref:Uncharacterized protein n=1 Tax=Pangasius djambal TaxID=1691987 RepID=A0ACC5ZKS6_9TELE|nr:hypothetical protein [Pangasius djambal]